MITNKVEICGVNTSKLPVLSGKEKEELLIKIKQGDEDARNKFIVGNLRLVLSVIQKFNSRGENADDLFQVGCVGLMKAIKNFDLSVGVKFSTYAVPMIIGEIRRYLRDYNSIRVSRSLKDIAYKALQAKEAILRESGAEPTIEQIAQKMELEPKQVTTALDAIQDPISLYEPVFSDGTDTLFVMDQVSDKKSLDENWIEEISLREAISKLSDREKNIINLRFFQGRTQMEVAGEIGISQAQVSRLEKNAIERIKKSFD
ncbi:MAG: RNA polymerase sporulation sigma factor SigG [Clostridia bacterium]|nr:RNA polymerase sporulation sigma factor SigG [Clostridia bacterium]